LMEDDTSVIISNHRCHTRRQRGYAMHAVRNWLRALGIVLLMVADGDGSEIYAHAWED